MKTEKDMARNVRTVTDCISVAFFNQSLSAKIREIRGMDFSDDVKQAAIKAIRNADKGESDDTFIYQP